MSKKQFLNLSKFDISLILVFLIAMGCGSLFLWNHRRTIDQRIATQKADQERSIQLQILAQTQAEQADQEQAVAKAKVKGDRIIQETENNFQYKFEILENEYLIFPSVAWKNLSRSEKIILMKYAEKVHSVSKIAYKDLSGNPVLLQDTTATLPVQQPPRQPSVSYTSQSLPGEDPTYVNGLWFYPIDETRAILDIILDEIDLPEGLYLTEEIPYENGDIRVYNNRFLATIFDDNMDPQMVIDCLTGNKWVSSNDRLARKDYIDEDAESKTRMANSCSQYLNSNLNFE